MKKLLALTLVLALTFGASTVALAAWVRHRHSRGRRGQACGAAGTVGRTSDREPLHS